eukprot:GHVP01055521.1.p1 GENE.GHVP01055521.1~~GHVP01055521.1.p1  ORF type:complete len:294 (-),score=48.95 GHVP01055521.1:919-1800(-)
MKGVLCFENFWINELPIEGILSFITDISFILQILQRKIIHTFVAAECFSPFLSASGLQVKILPCFVWTSFVIPGNAVAEIEVLAVPESSEETIVENCLLLLRSPEFGVAIYTKYCGFTTELNQTVSDILENLSLIQSFSKSILCDSLLLDRTINQPTDPQTKQKSIETLISAISRNWPSHVFLICDDYSLYASVTVVRHLAIHFLSKVHVKYHSGIQTLISVVEKNLIQEEIINFRENKFRLAEESSIIVCNRERIKEALYLTKKNSRRSVPSKISKFKNWKISSNIRFKRKS